MKQTIGRYSLVSELVSDLVARRHAQPTALIVCSTKAEFLRQLIPSLLLPAGPPARRDEIPSSPDDDAVHTGEPSPAALPSAAHPTLAHLASSAAVRLIFCPSIDILRAFLASAAWTVSTAAPGRSAAAEAILLNALALHHGTSEFSVQGLSRTLSTAVSAAAATSQGRVQLVECADVHDPEHPHRGARLWEAPVPLLSGSVKLGGEGAHWAGRTIRVRSVVRRWFQFEQSEALDHRERNEMPADMDRDEEEEMLV